MTGYRLDTTKTWDQTYRDLQTQFQRWANQRGKRIPWNVHNIRGRPEVTLTYQLPGQPEITLTMASQARDRDNLRVLFLAIEALRLNEYRGIDNLVREAYLALPAPVGERDPWEVLGLRPDAPAEVAKGAYQALAKVYHPDNGTAPDARAMAELNAAWEKVKPR